MLSCPETQVQISRGPGKEGALWHHPPLQIIPDGELAVAQLQAHPMCIYPQPDAHIKSCLFKYFICQIEMQWSY